MEEAQGQEEVEEMEFEPVTSKRESEAPLNLPW